MTYIVVTFSGMRELEIDWKSAVLNITMLQEFLGVRHIDHVYWTLHVELQFYVLMGLIMSLGLRRHLPWLLTILVGMNILVIAPGVFSEVRGWWRIEQYLPWHNLHLFLLGVIFFKLRSGWQWRYLPALGLCFLQVKLYNSWETSGILFCIAMTVFAASHSRIQLLRNRPLLLLGTISYSLYLVHQNIGYVLIRTGYAYGLNGHVCIIVATLVTLTLAMMVTFLVERPVSAFIRERYKKWRTTKCVADRRCAMQ